MDIILWSMYGTIIILYLLYKYLTRNHNYWSKLGINGPKPVAGFGNVLSTFLTEPIVLEKDWVNKYGKIYGTYEANKPILTVSDPALIKDILATDSHIFSINVTDPILQAPAHSILSQTLVASNGPEWRRVRSLFSPAFSTSRMRQMFGQMDECMGDMLRALEPYAREGRQVDMKLMYGAFAMDAITTCAFGTKVNTYKDMNNPFVANANRVFSPNPLRLLMSIMLPTFVLRAVMRHTVDESTHGFFFDMTRHIMSERKQSNQKYNDFLELFMSYEKNNDNNNNNNFNKVKTSDELGDNYVTREEILANAWDFFTTGYETNASTLSFATYELSLRPEIQDKLYNELKRSMAANDGCIDYELLNKMDYLDAVVTEALRMHANTLRVGRMAAQDYKLGDTGITLPKGQTVEIPIYAIHHSNEFYPDAEQFDPDRFMPQNRHKLIPYTYLPFGSGHRSCIGMRFSLMLVKLALAQVILNYRFTTCINTDIPVLLKQSGLTHSPERVILNVEPRL